MSDNWFQTYYPQSLQEILWAGVNAIPFWWIYAAVCAIGAIFMFGHMLQRLDHSLLTVARMVWLSGMIVGAGVPFNSACQPISALLIALAGGFMGVLVSTNWCYRYGTPKQKMIAIWGDYRAAWTTPKRDHKGPMAGD